MAFSLVVLCLLLHCPVGLLGVPQWYEEDYRSQNSLEQTPTQKTETSYAQGKSTKTTKPQSQLKSNLSLPFYTHEQSMNHISLNNKGRPRFYTKSPTGQDIFWTIPGLISCAGVTGRWGLLSHAQNAGLIHTTGRRPSNITALPAAVL